MTAAGALLGLLVAAAVSYHVVRSGRRVNSGQTHLLNVIRENHKRASTWNFRVSKRLRITIPAPPVSGAVTVPRPRPRLFLRSALLMTGSLLSGLLAVLATGAVRDLCAALAVVALSAAVLDAVITRVEHHVLARQHQLEHVVVQNHKRASVWNYHVSTSLGIGTESDGSDASVLRTLPEDNRELVTMKSVHAAAGALVESGVFDVEHYSGLVGGTFRTASDAASHYLTQNAPLEFSPTPFLDLRFLPDSVCRSLQNGAVAPLLEHLRDESSVGSRLSRLFDAACSGVDRRVAAEHPGGVLGAWLESMRSETRLAVPAGSSLDGLRAAEIRQALIEHARSVRAAARHAGPRSTDNWDVEAEQRWLQELSTAVVGDLPYVSVVMAVRDREGAIIEAIQSIQAQTHGRWQLLVVDDGSTDSTVEKVVSLAAEDDRIRLVHGTGAGVSNARNLGLAAVESDYVAFLDSDNRWAATFLETMLRGMLRHELGAAYAATALTTADSVRYRAFEGGLDHLLVLNHIDLNVFVIRADVMRKAGQFDESLRRWVDHDFAIKVAKVVEPVLLPFIGCWYDDSAAADDRITVRESGHWQWVALGNHWIPWEQASAPVEGRLSVVIPTYGDSTMSITATNSLLSDADAVGLDVEVIIVDNGSGIEVGQELIQQFGVGGRVRYHRLPRNLNFAIGCDVGLAMATGDLTLFLNNDTEVRSGALAGLVAAMGDPDVLGAQPLLVYADETIQTAGTMFSVKDGLPSHLLVNHPPADAVPLAGAPLDAVSAAALVVRTCQARDAGGFDPIYVNGMEDVDLCLRMTDRFGGHFVVVPEALVIHLESKTPGRGANVVENRRLFLERWRGRIPAPRPDLLERAGFRIIAVGSDGRDVPGPRPSLARSISDGRLRWGIKVSSVPGSRGDMWGDTHFAASLAAALERSGHRAVVYRSGAHLSSATAFDDVNLVIRGRDRVRPMPGQVNVLWVISHPEDVAVQEIREFDLVFAASVPWSREMTVLSGRTIEPLLQATDADRFHPTSEQVPHEMPLFIGGTHPGRERRVVTEALAAEVPIGVYGPGWEGMLPSNVYRGVYVPNEALAGYYRGAPRVLADHWDNMARDGFVQNRIFDAVASGARVVSDPVEGLDELFEGAVQVFSSPEDLKFLCGPQSDSAFPDERELLEIAERVRTQHSFENRAEQLTAAVSDLHENTVSSGVTS